MATHGGYRPGAGRKPNGAIVREMPQAQSPIRQAELKLSSALPDLVDVALKFALAGDRVLLMYCIDRVLGKSIQPIDMLQHVAEIAADFGVEPERVTSIVERLKAKRAG